MKRRPNPSRPDQARVKLARIADVLAFARSSMLLSRHETFVCGSFSCDENTGAFVERGARRGDGVTVCTRWLRGNLDFDVTTGELDGRAYALLHEFVHLAGPQHSPERYLHKDWGLVDAEEALEQGDGYAALAWVLGG